MLGLALGPNSAGLFMQICHRHTVNTRVYEPGGLKADFQSVEFSEQAEFLLFVGENVALKMNR